MNLSNENERFSAMQGGRGKIAAGIAESYFEDNFVPTTQQSGKKAV